MPKEETPIFAKSTKPKKATKTAKTTGEPIVPAAKNGKLTTIIICAVIGVIVLAGGLTALVLALNGGGNDNDEQRGGGLFSNEPAVEVKASETKAIEYETFNNGLVSMQIPKGWKVETNLSILMYCIHAYDPNHPERQIFAMLKSEGFNRNQTAKDWYARVYPDAGYARMPVINPQTTEAFFKAYPGVHNLRANEADMSLSFLPKYTDFTVIENMGTTILGGDLLRASYMLNGAKIQGLFTAKVVDFGIPSWVNIDPMNIFSTQINVAPLTVYDIFFFTAADADFNSWQPILDKCIGTIAYSQEFMQAHAKALQGQSELTQLLSKNAQEISDGIMDSWNKRQTSYDIISQKQSDATLGYERVKDTETGEIYRATNGFMDSYGGSRYQTITDNDYALGIDGYINLK